MGGECFSGLAYGDAQALNVGGDEPSSANAGCDGPDVDAGSRFFGRGHPGGPVDALRSVQDNCGRIQN